MKKANISFDNEPKDVRKTLNVFYNGMIGKELKFNTPFGEKPAVYADFTASGRAFAPLEDVINHDVLPYYSNIHSTGVTNCLFPFEQRQNNGVIPLLACLFISTLCSTKYFTIFSYPTSQT